MALISAVEQEIRDLINEHGPIPFARFMHACLYSPRGGFYASRDEAISAHFGTSSMAHPVFGALIARQLEQMWQLLGEPAVFHVVEAGCGDGLLAQAIVQACRATSSGLAAALHYVATDYAPRWLHPPHPSLNGDLLSAAQGASNEFSAAADITRVQGDGLRAFRNIAGCILSNELIDNFPVHRFAIQDGAVKEVFVTLQDERLTEVLGEPSSPRIEGRLQRLPMALPEGFRGEVSLAMDDWMHQVGCALERGFVLTIDYGDLAAELYAASNRNDTLVGYHEHLVTADFYRDIGRQDITAHVDFTSLMHLGDSQGLATVGYTRQRDFLTNLGFESFLDAHGAQGLSAARKELDRMAMLSLVDLEQYGNLKVLAQAKGLGSDITLRGFAGR